MYKCKNAMCACILKYIRLGGLKYVYMQDYCAYMKDNYVYTQDENIHMQDNYVCMQDNYV